MREACREATDRINDLHEHNRYGSGDLLERLYGEAGWSQYDVRRERDQFRRIFVNAVSTTVAILDQNVAPDGPTKLLEECGIVGLGL